MNAKDLVINDSSERQEVKDFCAVSPYVDRAILAQALVIKSVNLSNLSALVIASNKCDPVSVPYFES